MIKINDKKMIMLRKFKFKKIWLINEFWIEKNFFLLEFFVFFSDHNVHENRVKTFNFQKFMLKKLFSETCFFLQIQTSLL